MSTWDVKGEARGVARSWRDISPALQNSVERIHAPLGRGIAWEGMEIWAYRNRAASIMEVFDRNVLQLNRGDGTFAEIAQLSGLESSDWSWTAVFLDVDLDGYEDVLIPTGHDFDTQDSDMLERLNRGRGGLGERTGSRLLEYPRLPLPNLAFHNLGNLRFEEVGREWGFDRVGVKHGICCADLDNDGDLDVITNDLNDEAGVYRNDCIQPRVAVRLKGAGGNTRGIGAKIWLYGGAVPAQSQEMICGGRYLSGDDSVRVFGAGSETNRMTLEVHWRSGKTSVVQGVRANREYEVDEAGATFRRTGTSETPNRKVDPRLAGVAIHQ